MSKRRGLFWIPLVVIALLAVPVARSLWFYRGLPPTPEVPQPKLAGLTVPTPAAGRFVDQPSAGQGLVLLDRAHGNLFTPNETSVLAARLAARGLAVRDLSSSDDLATALHQASALVVIAPGLDYTTGEIAAVRGFVERGGRLLLVADPTRYTVSYNDYGDPVFVDTALIVNPLAAPFGLAFEDDYLYNVVKHEGNYQNILLEQFQASSLTEGLSQVAFYATHSIHTYGGGLILAGGETRSSTDELGRDLPVAALDETGQVLALGDLTFMTSPYAGVLDNGRLVANIADFLAGAERRYGVADFPYFFRDEVVLVPLGGLQIGTEQVGSESELQQSLRTADRTTLVRSKEDPSRDAFFVGLYAATEDVSDYLEAAGVTVLAEEGEENVTYTLDISGTGEVDTTGMALFSLRQDGDRRVLILLTDKQEDLQPAIETLVGGDMAGCLTLSDMLVLCAVGEGGGGGGTGGGGNGGQGLGVLIVSEDDLPEATCMSSLGSFLFALPWDQAVEIWSELEQGPPTLDDLRAYQAVIWTAGDCSGRVPDEQDAETLRQYVAGGGRLLIEGASIGADWNGTDFYAEVCHAESSHASPLLDLQVADAENPLATGYENGQVIDLVAEASSYTADVIAALPEADIAFTRGPRSPEAGPPAIITYESGRARVVYVAFPIYLLPDEDLDIIVANAVGWLLEP
jgi:hypothetical protein